MDHRQWIFTSYDWRHNRERTNFDHFEHYDGGSLRFGNNEPCCIKGKGHISLTNELVRDNAY